MHPKKPPEEPEVTRSTPMGTAGQIPCRGRRFRTCFLGKLRHGAAREGKAGGLEGTGSRRIHPVGFIKALLGPRPGQERLLAGCRGFWRAFPWPRELRPAAALALSSLRCPAAHLPCTRIATEPSESRPPARWRSLCWQEKKKKRENCHKNNRESGPCAQSGLGGFAWVLNNILPMGRGCLNPCCSGGGIRPGLPMPQAVVTPVKVGGGTQGPG